MTGGKGFNRGFVVKLLSSMTVRMTDRMTAPKTATKSANMTVNTAANTAANMGANIAANIAKVAGLVILLAASVFATPSGAEEMDRVVLQGLDKVTARVSTLETGVGMTARFGTLEIIARTCDKRPPTEPPESAAFLDIWEVREGEAAVSLFRGWMFASSPALNGLEHPVYDVWVLDCKNNSSSN